MATRKKPPSNSRLSMPKGLDQGRVAERVAHGGHDVPEADIERRFPRSLHNLFELYSQAADSCVCYLGFGDSPTLVFEQRGQDRRIIDDTWYRKLLVGAEP